MNEAMVMPKNASSGWPPTAASISTTATALLATLAMRCFSSRVCCSVMLTNSGTAPTGFTITSSARKNFVYSAQSSIPAL